MTRAHGNTPVRTCCGCGRRDQQTALVRVTVVGGRLLPDLARTCGGRGAYLHRQAACWDGFIGAKPYVRSLRRRIPVEERRQLRTMLGEAVLAARPTGRAG